MKRATGARLRVALSALARTSISATKKIRTWLLFIVNIFRFSATARSVCLTGDARRVGLGYQPTLAGRNGRSCRSELLNQERIDLLQSGSFHVPGRRSEPILRLRTRSPILISHCAERGDRRAGIYIRQLIRFASTSRALAPPESQS